MNFVEEATKYLKNMDASELVGLISDDSKKQVVIDKVDSLFDDVMDEISDIIEKDVDLMKKLIRFDDIHDIIIYNPQKITEEDYNFLETCQEKRDAYVKELEAIKSGKKLTLNKESKIKKLQSKIDYIDNKVNYLTYWIEKNKKMASYDIDALREERDKISKECRKQVDKLMEERLLEAIKEHPYLVFHDLLSGGKWANTHIMSPGNSHSAGCLYIFLDSRVMDAKLNKVCDACRKQKQTNEIQK